MQKKLFFLSSIPALIIILASALLISSCSSNDGSGGKANLAENYSSSKSKKASNPEEKVIQPLSLNIDGDAQFRLNALGGTIEVVDPQNSIYGAGLIIPANAYRDSNSPYITKQWFGGTIEFVGVASLEKLPEGLKFPESVEGKITYINKSKNLIFSGIMTSDMKNDLRRVSSNESFKTAVNELYQSSQNGGEPRVIVPSNPDPSFNQSRDLNSAVLIVQANDGNKDSYLSFLVDGSLGDKIILNTNLTDFTEDTNEFTDTDVKIGKSYTYFVKARNANESTPSGSVDFSLTDSCSFTITTAKAACGKSGKNPQIELVWKTDNNATSYDIYRNDKLYKSKIENTTFTDTKVTADTEYTYFIRAKRKNDTIDSDPVSVTATVSAPGAFALTALTATPSCNGKDKKGNDKIQIELVWESSTNATSYDIYRNNKVYKKKVTDTEFTDSKLKAGSTYTYFIKAINCSGSATSDTATASAKVDALEAPTLKATTAGCNGTSPQIKLEWEADIDTMDATTGWSGTSVTISSDTTNIKEGTASLGCVVDATGNGEISKSFSLSFSTTTYTMSFYTRCSAASSPIKFFLRDNAGNESYWNITTASTPDTFLQHTISLSSPNNNNNETKADLTNIASLGFKSLAASTTYNFDIITYEDTATTYDVYRDGKLYKDELTAKEFTDKFVKAGTEYTYLVKSVNCSDTTDSAPVSETASDLCKDAPESFTIDSTSSCNGKNPQIKLEWKASEGAAYYNIYRNDELYKSNITGTQFINSNIVAGTPYTYYVKAINSSGETDSNTVTETALSTCTATIPEAFTTFTAESDCSGSSTNPQVKLTWDKVSGATAYDVYRKGALYKSNVTKSVKTIKLVQLLEPPQFTITTVPNASIIGAPIAGIALSLQISFDISDSLNSGLPIVGGLPTRKFKNPVTIKIPYSKEVVDKLNIKLSKLKLYEFHGSAWKPPLTIDRIDEDNGLIYAKVKEFSIFQVYAPYKIANSLPLIIDEKNVEEDIKGVKVEGEKGIINITYNLKDTEGDSSDITIEYRKANAIPDLDQGWTKIIKKKSMSPGNNSFSWNSKSSIGALSGYYQIRVTPYQKIGGSLFKGGAGYSDVFRIDNSKTEINAPTKLIGTVIDDDDSSTIPQVSLTWTASTSDDVSGYNIYRQARFDAGYEKTFRKVGESSSTSFNDDTLVSSFYEAIYKLTAFDSSENESNFSRDIRLASVVLGAYYY
ncbi:MAG: hypothetical protein A3H37_06865 [Candidatus Schekmanbacteria bacterium RIFCSPLOWO2_02_FULL_38_14]|uniref:Fibronectin type-III domain-containing protein n=1 Tax=Candidatus Schekmanbacteria bacterium RIFCSPLOWO2_12_FULL_38_15 TaxID=1817883 RepID=A0A1F7SHA1_9BACT|nr:MAG: hypothetical protein A3H37_06865 [Candidatus Schekmanbacteria bacterium RIFCSPLOWO2_02_FULL_38_14]OGL52618.1 MAG: hypothetical protein A3G31_11685 [Candidatus Schekmanbacteria bacterium RIFCSPLOWO2_12_FULL_38_15]